MPRLVTLVSTDGITLPNGIRYPAGAGPIYLSDEEYSLLSTTFKASFLAADVPADTTPGLPSYVRIEDGIASNLATVAQFHNADNQQPGNSAFGLLTGGVAQLLNAGGNIDRQREVGTDGIAAVGIATGGAQFAMAFMTTDSTDNFTAGSRTFTPAAMSGTVNGVAWSIQAGSVLSLDSGASQEFTVVTAVAASTFTCVTTKTHNGTGTPFTISGFVYNQERDCAGELDGASGSGTNVAAEYEFNGGGAGNSNFDRARNLQGKGLAGAISWTGTLASTATSFTASSAPTSLGPGQPIFFYTTATGAITEVAYTALNYTAGSTSVLLKSGLANSHNSASESLRYDIYAAAGPALNGFLPTGIGIEEEALYDPVTGLFYIERAATQDGVAQQNVVIENPGLWNGASIDRQRGNVDTAALVNAVGATTTQTGADQVNYNGRGVKVVLNMATIGTGSVTLAIQGKDAASGQYYAILTGAAIVGNSVNVYTVYPGLPATANVSANDLLPRTWRVVVTANNANATTYTVGASVIV